MIEGMLVTAEQTAVLFLIMLFGYFGRRWTILDAASIKKLTAIVVNFTTPCIVIMAFQCPYDHARLPGLGWSLLIAIIWYAMGIFCDNLFFRSGERKLSAMLRWSVVFSNCGFMGLPLTYALFGAEGVFYCVVPIAVFNFIAWTYGVTMFRPFKGRADLIKGILNPANVAAVVALVLFFLPWRLPSVLSKSLDYVAQMNTPLPMFILGYYLGGANFTRLFTCPKCYLMLFLRHLAIPLALIAVLTRMPFIPTQLKFIAVVPAAAPVGVLLTVFSVMYDGDAEFSSTIVAVSTLFSIVTIPVVVGLARLFLG